MDLLNSALFAVVKARGTLPKHLIGDLAINLFGGLVSDHKDQIETRQERVRQSNVFHQIQRGVEVAEDRIGSRQNAAPRIQSHVHPGLGDGHALLFHGFVDGHAIHLVHLVKLVDANDPTICQDHRARLQVKLSRSCVPDHGRSEANTTGAPTSGTDGQWSGVHDEAKHLTLPTGWVAHQQDIDVSAQMRAIRQVLFNTTKHLEQQTSFHALMSTNGGRKGACQELEGVLSLRNLLDVVDIFGRKVGLCEFFHRLDVCGHQLCREDSVGEVLQRRWKGSIDPNHLDSVSRFGLVTKVAITDHFDAPGNLPRWRRIWRFLDGEMLRVLINAEGHVHLQVVLVAVLLWKAGSASGRDH
mmetsp:Transcript_7456/g.16911  ORF Transcript_7456/g.16911 Transcript_7456/m.16911 type:complete len:356 (-) Transcript_7456:561-1628(-)